MPLNYSKWDQLELSDDSDIEGHPNVDKRSLIRWKQRDIHEKRENRKVKIASLSAEIACNDVLLPRLQAALDSLKSPDPSFPSRTAYFNSLVDRLQRDPSPEKPPTNSLGQVATTTYDAMLLSLLMQVSDAAKKKVGEAKQNDIQAELGEALIAELNHHVVKFGEVQAAHRKDLAFEENEQNKHITSEDMHDGFQNKYVPPKPAPPPVPLTKVDKPKKTAKEKTTEMEVLNPKASASANPPSDPSPDSDDEGDSLPELTPSLLAFSHLPLRNYEQSFAFIQAHRDVVVTGAADALLVAAFRAQSDGKAKYAKQCVHQSLLLQYCDKLGGDGVRVFFNKMIQGDKRAEKVFVDDMESTYAHLVTRAAALSESSSGGTEQIQLVPENSSMTISFNVPTGPPPENLILEGPGTEDLDIEEARKTLQMRWDVFEGFDEEMKDALKKGTLEGVNKVLGSMSVEEAEDVVQKLDLVGILNFAEGGIRDETGKTNTEEI